MVEDFDRAQELIEKTGEIRERVLGSEHPETLSSRLFLATVHLSLGDYAQTRPVLEQTLEIQERVLGAKHPAVLGTKSNLALTLQNLGEHEQARLLQETVVASFERTLLSGDSDFDRYRAGVTSALTDSQRRGLALFSGRARCTFCHDGELFTDQRFHNTGISWRSRDNGAAQTIDLGRFEVTGRNVDRGAFRTPSLRDVALTEPYMHDGSLSTLEAVVEFYDQGGYPNAHLDGFLRPLALSAEERADLVAFLKSLTGRRSANN